LCSTFITVAELPQYQTDMNIVPYPFSAAS